jgi:Zn-finger nucleic acid-binding protein
MRRFFDVSGNDWWGDPQAPWNQPEPMYDTCPDCNGDGGVWYDEDGKEYSVADYERMSEEERSELEFDKCERCEGVGTIEVEPYEPDYDDYND